MNYLSTSLKEFDEIKKVKNPDQVVEERSKMLQLNIDEWFIAQFISLSFNAIKIECSISLRIVVLSHHSPSRLNVQILKIPLYLVSSWSWIVVMRQLQLHLPTCLETRWIAKIAHLLFCWLTLWIFIHIAPVSMSISHQRLFLFLQFCQSH